MKKETKKQMKKRIEIESGVSDKEIADLEKELKKLSYKDVCPKPDHNKGMELMLSAGNLIVFRNAEGVLYQMDISLETVEEGQVVLKKIKVEVWRWQRKKK